MPWRFATPTTGRWSYPHECYGLYDAEPDHFSVAVLDTAGNLILRIGKYGNVEDGQPLLPDPVLTAARASGGDETALMHACYVGVHSDKRLFIADAGNRRIASVKLGYHTEEKFALKDVPDQGSK